MSGIGSETAEYFQQTTLQLPSTDTTQQHTLQQRDGRQSTTGSQTMIASNTPATASTAAAAGPAAAGPTSSGDVVINIDERQPLICRSDHILTIDTVCVYYPVHDTSGHWRSQRGEGANEKKCQS